MILDSSNLFIVFSGACGGNHVANILSLLPQFAKRLNTTDDYQEVLLRTYTEKNKINSIHKTAHISSEEILEKNVIGVPDIKIQRLNNKMQADNIIKIFLGHHHLLYDWGEIEEFYDNSFFLTMTYPKIGSIPEKRSALLGMKWDWSSENYSFAGLNTPPAGSNINWSLNVPKSKYIEIDTEHFWTTTGCDYLEDSLGLDLPKIAKNMHSIWLSWFENIK